MDRRVVITGLGIVSPLGVGKESFWQALAHGRSGIRRLTRFDPTGYDSQIAGEIPDQGYLDLLPLKRRRRMSHVAQIAAAGAQLALDDAGLSTDWPHPHAVGVIVGTSLGSFKEGMEQQALLLERGAKRINPFLTIALHINAISAEVAISAQSNGVTFTVGGGCASSICALGVATDMIRSGALDVCLSGGAESPLHPLVFAGLCRTQEMAIQNEWPEKACRPFDQGHEGLVVSEGGCILILEERTRAEQRGAPIYAEILGHAMGSEAYDSFLLEPSGEHAAQTLRLALNQAGLSAQEIEWVNAHGSSCPSWDRKETQILKKVLGPTAQTTPISATKSMTGHTFGAAASFQVASAALAMQHNLLPPTINLEVPDPACDLDYVPQHARPLSPQTCLVNSFAYGGINSFLILGQA